jgi:hypothetical protein
MNNLIIELFVEFDCNPPRRSKWISSGFSIEAEEQIRNKRDISPIAEFLIL